MPNAARPRGGPPVPHLHGSIQVSCFGQNKDRTAKKEQQGTIVLDYGTFPNRSAVFAGGKAGFALEDAAKVGGIFHVQRVGYFFAAHGGKNQQALGFQQYFG